MFSAFEVDPASLVARFTEGLQLMKACWTESRINFAGRFWQLEGATVEPKPFQKPHSPLWIGGNHPTAVRRALRDARVHITGLYGHTGVSSPTLATAARELATMLRVLRVLAA